MSRMLTTAVLSLAICAASAPAARADGFGITFGKQTKHGSFAVSWSTGPYHTRAHHAPYAPRSWVPAHYEPRCEQVWVPGCTETVWVPAVYEWRHDACGRTFKVCVAPGHYRVVQRPGHYVTRETQVWVGGCWQSACG